MIYLVLLIAAIAIFVNYKIRQDIRNAIARRRLRLIFEYAKFDMELAMLQFQRSTRQMVDAMGSMSLAFDKAGTSLKKFAKTLERDT